MARDMGPVEARGLLQRCESVIADVERLGRPIPPGRRLAAYVRGRQLIRQAREQLDAANTDLGAFPMLLIPLIPLIVAGGFGVGYGAAAVGKGIAKGSQEAAGVVRGVVAATPYLAAFGGAWMLSTLLAKRKKR